MSDDYIKWESRFEIGIPQIDKQHKKLVDICNDLHFAIMNRRKSGMSGLDDSLRKALHEAVQYVRIHFATEEGLMKEAGYPDFDNHKKKHELFIRKILETAKLFETSSFSQSIQFVRFIYDWILEHIAYDDLLYVKCVRDFKQTVLTKYEAY